MTKKNRSGALYNTEMTYFIQNFSEFPILEKALTCGNQTGRWLWRKIFQPTLSSLSFGFLFYSSH